MTFEKFQEKFYELSISERVAIYNEYCMEHGDADNILNDFDEEFFETFFGDDKMEICRATFFGKIESWSDEYIRFDAYGNLESLDEFRANEEIEDYLNDIYENKDVWEDYIEDDEENEEG